MATPSTRLGLYPSRYLKVVHIPIDIGPNDPSARLEEVRLIHVGLGGVPGNACNDVEKELGWVPDLREFKSFSWNHRSLLGIKQKSNPHQAKNWKARYKADYMIYVCLDEPYTLGRNHRLEYIAECHLKSPKDSKFKTRGDAFVFRMVKKPGPEGSRLEYVDMDEEFVTSADVEGTKPKVEGKRPDDEGFAHIILRELFQHSTPRFDAVQAKEN